jgi:hypothetical protein
LTARAGDREGVASRRELELRPVDVAYPFELREVDADRLGIHRVQAVDERLAAASVVERVLPPSVHARRPGDRQASHVAGLLVRHEHRLVDQAVVSEVVLANDVVGELPGRVLDQEQAESVRREGVEAEVAREGEALLHSHPPIRPDVDDDEARALARELEPQSRLGQHEPRAVARKPAGGAVGAHDRDAERAIDLARCEDLAPVLVDLEHRRFAPVADRRVPGPAPVGSDHPGALAGVVGDRRAAGPAGRRGERQAREGRGQKSDGARHLEPPDSDGHASSTDDTRGEVPR